MATRNGLLEVLQNLVENALKIFLAPAGLRKFGLVFKAIRQPDRVFCQRPKRYGIEPRFHESIFGLFNKLDSRSEGMGIGLALVRRIVEFHDGSIWVESAGPGRVRHFISLCPAARHYLPRW